MSLLVNNASFFHWSSPEVKILANAAQTTSCYGVSKQKLTKLDIQTIVNSLTPLTSPEQVALAKHKWHSYHKLSSNLKALVRKINNEKSFIWRLLGWLLGLFNISLLSQEEKFIQKMLDYSNGQLQSTPNYSKINKDKLSYVIQKGFRLLPHLDNNKAEKLELNGAWQKNSLNLIRNEMTSFLDTYAKKISEFDKAIIKEHNKMFSCAIENCQATSTNIDKYVEKIQQQITALEVQRCLIIPGGTREHSIIYKIKRESDFKYSLEIYNTGIGLAHTFSFHKAQSRKYTTLLLQKLTSSTFLKTLLEFRITGSKEYLKNHVSQDTDYNAYITQQRKEMNRLLEFIDSNFDWYRRGLGDTYPFQVRGTCSFESITAFLKGSLPKHLFHALQLHMTEGAAITAQKAFNAVFSGDTAEDLCIVANSTLTEKKILFKQKKSKHNWFISEEPLYDPLNPTIDAETLFNIKTFCQSFSQSVQTITKDTKTVVFQNFHLFRLFYSESFRRAFIKRMQITNWSNRQVKITNLSFNETKNILIHYEIKKDGLITPLQMIVPSEQELEK
ncbi:MAG: hypothetical protein P4L16_05885 [Chlamydiales bacterium]|nr:hypothetical protein [Chlamydiales bacterium]